MIRLSLFFLAASLCAPAQQSDQPLLNARDYVALAERVLQLAESTSVTVP
jgi:hypothetical protein